jgi:tRNA pseudouridine(55) synthase
LYQSCDDARMEKRITVEKHLGETPLQALERTRKERGIDAGIPMTYAGRLDPMAEGKLLVLLGDECKRRENYEALDKEYVFEILFGYASDSGDILGMANKVSHSTHITSAALSAAVQGVGGLQVLPYPAYSSKTVDGTPLFALAREGKLPEKMPERSVRIYQINVEDLKSDTGGNILADLEGRIGKLQIDTSPKNPYGDFRRDEVLARWREVLSGDGICTIARVRAVCSSGTYIRSLAPRIGAALGTSALAYSIRRTRIGRYLPLWGGWGVWTTSL